MVARVAPLGPSRKHKCDIEDMYAMLRLRSLVDELS